MATFWEKASHLVTNVLFVLCLFVLLFDFSHFGFEGEILILIATAPGHCLPFTSLAYFHGKAKIAQE